MTLPTEAAMITVRKFFGTWSTGAAVRPPAAALIRLSLIGFIEFLSRPLKSIPKGGCRGCTMRDRLPQKRMARPPCRRRPPGAPCAGRPLWELAEPGVIGSARPLVDLVASGIHGDAVTLLNLADELVPATRGGCEIIVRELAPLLLGSSSELLPIAFDAIPVHVVTSLLCEPILGRWDINYAGGGL